LLQISQSSTSEPSLKRSVRAILQRMKIAWSLTIDYLSNREQARLVERTTIPQSIFLPMQGVQARDLELVGGALKTTLMRRARRIRPAVSAVRTAGQTRTKPLLAGVDSRVQLLDNEVCHLLEKVLAFSLRHLYPAPYRICRRLF
jgi:hypothetical protein